jgi:hypothetical protein
MITLVDTGTGRSIGTITEGQLQGLIQALEEESTEDRDYYINRATIKLLADRGADPYVVTLLRDALGERSDMDIRWEGG